MTTFSFYHLYIIMPLLFHSHRLRGRWRGGGRETTRLGLHLHLGRTLRGKKRKEVGTGPGSWPGGEQIRHYSACLPACSASYPVTLCLLPLPFSTVPLLIYAYSFISIVLLKLLLPSSLLLLHVCGNTICVCFALPHLLHTLHCVTPIAL